LPSAEKLSLPLGVPIEFDLRIQVHDGGKLSGSGSAIQENREVRKDRFKFASKSIGYNDVSSSFFSNKLRENDLKSKEKNSQSQKKMEGYIDTLLNLNQKLASNMASSVDKAEYYYKAYSSTEEKIRYLERELEHHKLNKTPNWAADMSTPVKGAQEFTGNGDETPKRKNLRKSNNVLITKTNQKSPRQDSFSPDRVFPTPKKQFPPVSNKESLEKFLISLEKNLAGNLDKVKEIQKKLKDEKESISNGDIQDRNSLILQMEYEGEQMNDHLEKTIKTASKIVEK
jgi:hypothetical protein